MKIIALGDTHGRDDWKFITTKMDFDKVVFIGDYFDTHYDIGPQVQKDNFRDIVQFKRTFPDRVVLLFGNHDYHYLPSTHEAYSGFQEWQKTDIGILLANALPDMQMCFELDGFLFSHAGVTQTWCNSNGVESGRMVSDINDLLQFKPQAFQFKSGKNQSPYGDDITQSPIWVRPQSLQQDRIEGYTQVVGHTTQDEVKFIKDLILIDTLGTSGQYLEITNGTAVAVKP